MISPAISKKFRPAMAIGLLLVAALSSCTFSLPSQTPVIQTVQVTRMVTQLVTQEITREVTQVVEVPVTVTPSETPIFSPTPTLSPTITPIPSLTSTPEAPVVTITGHSQCLYGPGSVYLSKVELNASTLMEVVGRNQDGSWLYIQPVHGWNGCWIDATLAKFVMGDITGVQIVYSMLLYSNQYQPPVPTAQRTGNDVTIYWNAVWMASDDYRGYLIEAWVCQGGTQVFLPIGYAPKYVENTGLLGVTVTDEPGCIAPSSARIYAAEKHGYSNWRKIDWPQPPQMTITPAPTGEITPTP